MKPVFPLHLSKYCQSKPVKLRPQATALRSLPLAELTSRPVLGLTAWPCIGPGGGFFSAEPHVKAAE